MSSIEYIGPRPKKPTNKSWAGGWLMICLVIISVGLVAKPFFSKAIADNKKVTPLNVEETAAWLNKHESSDSFGSQLAVIALERTKENVAYDPSYFEIPYPNGDIPSEKGNNTDVIIRSYRALGIDLQELVHNDMDKNFRIYPQLWNLKKPDTNIDHRRVPNLQRFFSRHGTSLESSSIDDTSDYKYGDIVVWRRPDTQTDIGIIVPGPNQRSDEKWIVHNSGNGTRWENRLSDYQIIGHYRYDGAQ